MHRIKALFHVAVWLHAAVLGQAAETATATQSSVKMPDMFSAHMVLQRDAPVPIWGTASPGATVTAKFRSQTKAVTADADGKWKIMIDPLTAGGPDVLQVNEVALEDVLVGEVWLGSGQSNMEATFEHYRGGDPVLSKLAENDYPQIRQCWDGKGWQIVTPKSCPWMSAELVTFGIRLQENLKVPVGLLAGALGNTGVEDWFTEAMFKADAPGQEVLAKAKAAFNSPEQQKWRADKLAAWSNACAAARAAGQPEPGRPDVGSEPTGAYRGRLSKMGQCFEERIQPMVGYRIRGMLWDQGESGGGPYPLEWGSAMGVLIRSWRKAWGQPPAPEGAGASGADVPFLFMQKPSGGGCAWDPSDPVTTQASPFQKADPVGRMGPGTGPGREWNGNYRGIGLAEIPNTAMVITRDLGGSMHPVNKSGYGTRAARVALGMVYGQPIEYYGPVYDYHVIEGNRARVFFTHVGKGLAPRHSEQLQGFGVALRTEQGLLNWYWAQAAIEKDPTTGRETVVLSSPEVPNPAGVCYAWGHEVAWANFFNQDGLPALTFAASVAEEPKPTTNK
jgi:sialate O-acetylesterase